VGAYDLGAGRGGEPFLAGHTGPFALDLLLACDLTRHHSNDAFYNYTSARRFGGQV
jgi:hypothetical protein